MFKDSYFDLSLDDRKELLRDSGHSIISKVSSAYVMRLSFDARIKEFEETVEKFIKQQKDMRIRTIGDHYMKLPDDHKIKFTLMLKSKSDVYSFEVVLRTNEPGYETVSFKKGRETLSSIKDVSERRMRRFVVDSMGNQFGKKRVA